MDIGHHLAVEGHFAKIGDEANLITHIGHSWGNQVVYVTLNNNSIPASLIVKFYFAERRYRSVIYSRVNIDVKISQNGVANSGPQDRFRYHCSWLRIISRA